MLDLDLHGFVRQLEEADDEYWSVLAPAVRGFLARADDEVLAGVRVWRKMQAWLLAGDHREELVDLLRWQRENPGDIPTEVRDGQVLACFPTLAAPDAPRTPPRTPAPGPGPRRSWRPRCRRCPSGCAPSPPTRPG